MKAIIALVALTFVLALPVNAFANVSINEFVSHPSSGNKEWVEFYNPDNVDITSYWLDDDTDFNSDTGSSAKKSLSSIDKSNSIYPFLELSSAMLNNDGDFVVLFDNNGTVIDQFEYSSDFGTDTSMGRFPDGSSSWFVLSSLSKGATNNGPVPTATPTPTETPTPTPTPKPTATSTPAKTPTPASNAAAATPAIKPTVTPTPTPVKSIPISITASASAQKSTQAAVLGQNIQISISPTISNQKETKVLAVSDNKLIPKLLIFLGFVFFVLCAIVIFYPTIKEHIKLKRNG